MTDAVAPQVSFDWGDGAPAFAPAGFGADTFAARLTGSVEAPVSGTYTFRTRSDDGVRLTVDGKVLVDQWNDHAAAYHTGAVTLESGRRYAVAIDYYDNRGRAVLGLEWRRPGASAFEVVPQARLYPTGPAYGGDGLSAVFIDSSDTPAAAGRPARTGLQNAQELRGPVAARTARTVNFDWGTGAAVPGVGADTFGARFAGRVVASAATAGDYVFRTRAGADDGVRLRVNDELVLDQWGSHGTGYRQARPVALQPGDKYHIVLEYFDNAGGAAVGLEWKRPGDAAFTPVPQDVLFSDQTVYPQQGLYPAAEQQALFGPGAAVVPKDGPGGLGVVSVKAFGAVGDGITDDTDAIQRAIASQVGQFTSNSHLYFPAGTYRITRTLQYRRLDPANPDTFGAPWQARLWIEGQQRDQVVIRLDDTAPGFADARDDGAARIQPVWDAARERVAGRLNGDSKHDEWVIRDEIYRSEPGLMASLARDPGSNALLVTGFENQAFLRPYSTGTGGDQAFDNSVYNMTFHTGRGNPTAVGINYNVCNAGALRNVRVVSGDGAGAVGVNGNSGFMSTNGPGLVTGVTVDGFDVGIDTGGGYNLTLEHIRLRDQNEIGLLLRAGATAVRDVDSDQRVRAGAGGQLFVPPAVQSGLFWAQNTVIDADLSATGDGSAAHNAALAQAVGFKNWGGGFTRNWDGIWTRDGGSLFLRDVTATGYGYALADYREGKWFGNAPYLYPTVDGEFVHRSDTGAFFSSAADTAFDGTPAKSLDLPVRDQPELPTQLMTDLAGVRFVAPTGNSTTDLANLRAAVNDPATRVLLLKPGATYYVNDTLDIPYHVKWISGNRTAIIGWIDGASGFTNAADPRPIVRVLAPPAGTPGDRDTLDKLFISGTHMSRGGVYDQAPVASYGIQMAGPRSLVLRSAGTDVFGTPNGGDLYAEDGARYVLRQGQRAWLRAINTEGPTNVNDGGTAWVLGVKSERPFPTFATYNGGKTEVLGWVDNFGDGHPDRVALINDNSDTFVTHNFWGPAGIPRLFALEVKGDKMYAVKTIDAGGVGAYRSAAAATVPTNLNRLTNQGLWLFDESLQDIGNFRSFGLNSDVWEGAEPTNWAGVQLGRDRDTQRFLHKIGTGTGTLFAAQSRNWSDYGTSARLWPTNGATASILSRVSADGGSFYELRLSRPPAADAYFPVGPVSWRLLRVNNGAEAELAAGALPASQLAPEDWAFVRLTVRGRELTVESNTVPQFWTDNPWSLLARVTDTSAGARLSGRTGVRGAGGEAWFDDVVVITPSGFPEPGLVASDSFADASALAGWAGAGTAWTVQPPGELAKGAGGSRVVTATAVAPTAADQRVTGWVRPGAAVGADTALPANAPAATAGVVGRVKADGSGYYALTVSRRADRSYGWSLVLQNGTTSTVLRSGDLTAADVSDGWSQLRLTLDGDQITAEISSRFDGPQFRTLAAVTDRTLATGGAGLFGDGGPSRFDDFVVEILP